MIQFIVKEGYDEIPECFEKKKGHIICEINDNDNDKKIELKEQFPQGFFRLCFWEKGGQFFDYGEAYLVSNTKGERLAPVVIRKNGWLANAEHALFIGKKLCVLHLFHKKKDLNLTLKSFEINYSTGDITEELIWEGREEDLDDLPEDFLCFKEMIYIGIDKVLEYRCLYPRFYED